MAVLTVYFVEHSVAKKLANLRLRGEPSLPAVKAESARGGWGGGLDRGKSWRAGRCKYWVPLVGLHGTSCPALAGAVLDQALGRDAQFLGHANVFRVRPIDIPGFGPGGSCFGLFV